MDNSLPITGVCIVSDPGKCPPNYTVIDKTFDRPEDADLWKDGLFTRRVMRYLCLERDLSTQGKDVLVDVALINERDPCPPGFTVLEYTQDTREKATQKKYIYVRWMIPSMTADAITDLILTTRNQRRIPTGYTLVGEINNMSLCYKMGKVPTTGNSNQSTPSQEVAGYTATPQTSMQGSGLPYCTIPSAQTASGDSQPRPGTAATVPGSSNVLSGIEWKMNSRYNVLMELQNLTIPEIRAKTMGEVESQYTYDFSTERSVCHKRLG